MALVVRGKTACSLCGKVHQRDDDVVLCPAGLFEPAEPLFVLNDAGVHRDCLMALPFAGEALARLDRYLRGT